MLKTLLKGQKKINDESEGSGLSGRSPLWAKTEQERQSSYFGGAAPRASGQGQWQKFLAMMQMSEDLVLVTMFQDALFMNFDEQTSILSISFLKKFSLFRDVLEKEKSRWSLVLQKAFGYQVQLQYDFLATQEQQQETGKKSGGPIAALSGRSPSNFAEASSDRLGAKTETQTKQPAQAQAAAVDVSDTTSWKLANELMKHFDGVITQVSRDKYE